MFGYVLYPDGGCRGQNEYGGAGIHGYRWNLTLTPKGIGHTTHSASLRGYDFKAETFDFDSKDIRTEVLEYGKADFLQWASQDTTKLKTPKVDKDKKEISTQPAFLTNFSTRAPVERYYDSAIPLEFGGTNNTAELNSAIHCLEMISQESDFDQAVMIVIRQDSQYVVDGHNLHMANWIANKFIRRDGTPIRNPELWLKLSTISKAIQDKGVKIIFEWVRAHGTDIGNNSADVLATMALFTSKSTAAVALHDSSFRVTAPADYWGTKSELRHPMMCLRYCFIDIATEQVVANEYYLSTQGKLEEMNGKRTSDDGFSIVRCAKQSRIEAVVAKQVSLPREIDYKFQVDLDTIYGADSRYVDIYGTEFLHRALDHKRHLQTYGKVLMTKELHPPFLTERLFDNMDILSDFLDNYQKTDQPTLTTTDITDYFYTITQETVKVKKDEEARVKLISTLKPDIAVGFHKMQVPAFWKETVGTVEQCEITLRLGIDLPERNALRKLEELLPKVYLLTHTLGPGAFMHAVIIEAGEDVGIWSGINSSIRVIAKKPTKTVPQDKTA